MELWVFFLYGSIAYLIGSIISAVVVCKLMGLPDPRTAGSKNPGVTNVLRIGSKKAAALTLFGDFLKGFCPVAFIVWYYPHPSLIGIAMFASVIGHMYPIFFRFEGGKGVATAFGALVGADWRLGLAAFGTWLLVAAIFRISSLAAIVTVILAPLLAFLLVDPQLPIAVFALTTMILIRHQANIQRLLAGTEPKLGKRGA